ncbi:MAG: hypothetical protein KF831_03260 [Acidobacteria bacterium]|nr:hypothetical protein [Acidobacteriota bacterium]
MLKKQDERKKKIRDCIREKLKANLRDLSRERDIELDDAFLSALTAGIVGALSDGGKKVITFRRPKLLGTMRTVNMIFGAVGAVLATGAYEGSIGAYNYRVKVDQSQQSAAIRAKEECEKEIQ